MGLTFSIYNDKITPGADNTSDIGSASLEWRDLYIDGTAYIDNIGESIVFADNIIFTFGTGTGIKLGAATNNKIAFYGATPVVKAAATADIKDSLANLGLITNGGATPLNLDGGLLTAGSATITTLVTAGTVSASGAVIGASATITNTITVGTGSITGGLIVAGSSTVGGLLITDNRNVTVGTGTGTTIATGTNQKLGFYNATAVVQPSTTGETVGFTAGSGTAVNDDSTFTGNVGTTAYRISDIVQHLKNLGLIAQ